MTDLLSAIDVDVVRISAKTCWIFVHLRSEAGFEGFGEASLQGRESRVVDVIRSRAKELVGAPAEPRRAGPTKIAPLAEAAADSAIAQALADLAARRRGLTLAQDLGGQKRARIPLYANINRRTVSRSPEGFAASARDAKAAGHIAFKLAPFDEVTLETCHAGTAARGMEKGLACAAAVRDAVGPGHDVMIDCHWRFDERSAADLIRGAAEIGLVWIECPLPETPENIPAIRRLRSRANDRGIRLAGCEEFVGLESFAPFMTGAYDVLMPDVKYCGGPEEMLRIADAMARSGVAFSPHNPSGPICHAASLQVCATVTPMDRLEVQFDEGPLFAELVREPTPECVAGESPLPLGSGLGLTLDPAIVAQTRVTNWSSEERKEFT